MYSLSIIVGTYNRLKSLRRCIESIFKETTHKVKLYVTDAGSTDGTMEFLKGISSEKITPIFSGKKLGQAKAYNDVFQIVETPFSCWLSDDNTVVNRGLDRALDILERNSHIGMVALKTKDITGPFVNAPYIGGISPIGILNVNQGVLPTKVLHQVGGFSEEFRDYGIDPDLTAKVLFAGHKVVYTKKIALHHFRSWNMEEDSEEYRVMKSKHERFYELYNVKYRKYFQEKERSGMKRLLQASISILTMNSFINRKLKDSGLLRDFSNVVGGRYIGSLDLIKNMGRKYHLVQCLSKGNV